MDATGYAMDYEARRGLSSWQQLQERSQQIAAEPRPLRGFQPEPEHPDTVGMNEMFTDEFTPEELIELTTPREPLVMDWDDALESVG